MTLEFRSSVVSKTTLSETEANSAVNPVAKSATSGAVYPLAQTMQPELVATARVVPESAHLAPESAHS